MHTDFEHRLGARDFSAHSVSKAGVEEARVVGAKISNGWIVSHHFSRMVRPHANSLLRRQEIKFSRLKKELAVSRSVARSPELGPVVLVDPAKVYGGGVLLGLIRDHLGMPVALKIDGHVEASIDVGLPGTVFIAQNQTVPFSQLLQVVIRRRVGLAAHKAQLIEPHATLHNDWKCSRNHLDVQSAAVSLSLIHI